MHKPSLFKLILSGIIMVKEGTNLLCLRLSKKLFKEFLRINGRPASKASIFIPISYKFKTFFFLFDKETNADLYDQRIKVND